MTTTFFSRRDSWLIKAGLMLAWPVLIAIVAIALIPVWFILPFTRFGRKPEGGFSFKFSWDSNSSASAQEQADG